MEDAASSQTAAKTSPRIRRQTQRQNFPLVDYSQTLFASWPNPIALSPASPHRNVRRRSHRSLLNPARNLYRLETLNVGVHAPAMRALQHANYTFAKKISHTATPDQRHRMVPGSRPFSPSRHPRTRHITPCSAKNRRAKEVYDRAMLDAWTAKISSSMSASLEIALYLLPNA